jgi:hypothetical protein
MPPPNQREREEKRRRERLALIDEQIRNGTLTIRQMTPAERKQGQKSKQDADGRSRPRRP